ncbi:MAG: PhnD/SsuA/transferrin family substrate-binding protein [Pseudomonadota bacterium]
MRLLVLIIALLSLPALGADAAPLRFAPLPMVDKELMVQEFLGPVRYMTEHSGQPIELVHTASYDELIKRFSRNEIDLAYIGPLPYLLLNRNAGTAQPLVRFLEPDGRDTYTCALVVFGHASFDPATSGDARLTLPDPQSTCGRASIDPLLRSRAVDPSGLRVNYAGRHDAVALAVVLGETDVGGLKTAIARKYSSLGLHIVAESPPVPGFVLVANPQTVSEAIQSRLRDALLALPKAGTEAAQAQTHGWNASLRHGAVSAEDRDFDTLRVTLQAGENQRGEQ